jgi:hypothetical protein
MTRGWPAGLVARIASGEPFHAAALVQIGWPSGTVRVHTGAGLLSWSGHDWIGVGEAGWISLPEELAGLSAEPGTLLLGGLPEEVEAELLDDPRGNPVSVWFATVTTAGGAVIEEGPGLLWTGLVTMVSDTERPSALGADYQISLTVTGRASQKQPLAAVHSRASQQARVPGDTSMRWAEAGLIRSRAGVKKWSA